MADDPSYDLTLDEASGVDRAAFDLQMDRATSEAANPTLKPGDPSPKRRLFEIHLGLNELIVYPLNTLPTPKFFKQKYPRIRSINIDLPSQYDLPEDKQAAEAFLRIYLPQGFIHDPAYGLGVMKEMRPMIAAIETLPGVVDLVIRDRVATHVDGTTFMMNREDYEVMRLAFQRIARNYQADSLADRAILAHNAIPHRLNPAEFPEKSRPYKPGTVFKLLGGAGAKDVALRGRDRRGLMAAVASNAKAIADNDPQEFMQLQKDIEIVSLDKLILGFSKLMKRNYTESAWQKLFELNPFILSMVFGYPVVLIAAGASVGGLSLTGQGTKIADFLMENEGTHNAALVEIKTPQTELFGAEYRTGVWTPSKHVTSAIVQVLDQRTKLVTNLTTLKHSSDLPSLQAYSVDCVIVIGRTPEIDAKKSSLELIRTQLKDVRIVTFDELLGKLHLLRELIAGERYEAPQDEEEVEPDPFAGLIDTALDAELDREPQDGEEF